MHLPAFFSLFLDDTRLEKMYLKKIRDGRDEERGKTDTGDHVYCNDVRNKK
jgi:hypothetical protein